MYLFNSFVRNYVNCVVTLFRLHASCIEYNNHNYDNDSVNYYVNDDKDELNATTFVDITEVVCQRQFNIIINGSCSVDSGNYDAVDSC